MTTIKLVQTPQGETSNLYQAIEKKIGKVPNFFKALAHSPAALNAYIQQSDILSKGVLPAKLREQLAITVAGTNHCDYCASAHTLLAKNLGIEDEELGLNLQGNSNDSKTQKALSFAKKIVEKQGVVASEELENLREEGFTEGEIVEIVAHVGMNIFSNYFNNLAGTQVDFPLVKTT